MKSRLLIVLVLMALVFTAMAVPREANAATAFCHKVRPGESITLIANRYGVTVTVVKRANNMWNNTIYAGQCLLIPGKAPVKKKVLTYKCTKIHIVRRGQYVKTIARKYGVTQQAIVRANRLKNPNLIYVGQRLKIPTVCKKTVWVKSKPTSKPWPKPCPPYYREPAKPWYAKYWNNRWLSGNPKWTTRYGGIDLNFGYQGPRDGINGYNFSSRFTRDRYMPAGSYRFYIRTDDGARLWVDSVKIIDEWQDQAPRTYFADMDLNDGLHHFQIDHYQNRGVAQIRFWVEPILGPVGPGPGGSGPFTCDLYNNTGLEDPIVTTQWYNSLNKDWGRYAPAPGVTADFFSMRCTSTTHFSEGDYDFRVATDDGIKVWVDDNLIIDQWRVQGVSHYGADIHLGEGDHTVKVEYFENMGRALVRVGWARR